MNETGRAFNWFTPMRFGILLALLIFAAFPQVVLGLQTFVVRDYGFFSYPLAHFQKQLFWHGEIPFWDPYNYCGAPFLAQWNTMPLYPGALIYLLLPLNWSLSFFCLLHLWFGGLGMYFLARRWTGNNFASAFAGTVFSFNGVSLNLLMWPSHTATFAWMPWVVLAVESAWGGGARRICLAVLAGAMQMLAGGPEIIFFTWVILLVLWIQQLFLGTLPRAKLICLFPLMVVLVIALTSVQLLPFLDLAGHSERHGNFADLRWSMPASGWANYLVPMLYGNTRNMGGVFFQYDQLWTSSYYLGIGTVWLALLAILPPRESRVRPLSVLVIIAFVFALGENTFVYPALRNIFPALSMVTYPVKYVLLITFIAPLLAAFTLAKLVGTESAGFKNWIVTVGAILLASIGGIIFCAIQFPHPGDDTQATIINGLTRAVILLVTGVVLIKARGNGNAFHRIAPLVLICIAWLDVLTHEPQQNPTVRPSVYQADLARQKLEMDPQPVLGGSRAMLSSLAFFKFVHTALPSPENNFLVGRLAYGADANLLDGVPKVDGFFSLIPRECDDFQSLLYGATNSDYPALEDFMEVSQLTAPDQIYHWQVRTNFMPLITAGQKPVFLDDADAQRAMTRPDFDPRRIVILSSGDKALVTVTNRSMARVLSYGFGLANVDAQVDASGPSLIVISQTYYHDWRAFVDGTSTPLLRANDAFQAVEIPSGKHQLRLVYMDKAFREGAIISVFGWLICLAGLTLKPRNDKE